MKNEKKMKNKKNLRKVAGGDLNFGGGFHAGGSVGIEDNSQQLNTLTTVNKSDDKQMNLQFDGKMTLF